MRSLKSNKIGFKYRLFFSLSPSPIYIQILLCLNLAFSPMKCYDSTVKCLVPNWVNSSPDSCSYLYYPRLSSCPLHTRLNIKPTTQPGTWPWQGIEPETGTLTTEPYQPGLKFLYFLSTLRKLSYTDTKLWSILELVSSSLDREGSARYSGNWYSLISVILSYLKDLTV